MLKRMTHKEIKDARNSYHAAIVAIRLKLISLHGEGK